MLEIIVIGDLSLSVLGSYYASVILFGCIFYILEQRLYQGTLVFSNLLVLLTVLLSFAIMLFLAYYEYGNMDVRAAIEVGEVAYAGRDIYKEGLLYPYFPYWVNSILFWKHVSVITHLPLSFLLKLTAIFTNIIFACFVLLSSYKKGREKQNIAFLIAFSPVLIVVSTVLGQFDIIPTFLVFLAFTTLAYDKKRWQWSALLLGFGIGVKTFPLILIPAFLAEFSSKKRMLGYLSIVLVPILFSSLLAVEASPIEVFKNVFNYRGMVSGSWGFGALFWALGDFFEHVVKIPIGQHAMDYAWNLYKSFGVYLFFVFIVICYLSLFKRMSLLERIVYTYLGFYVFSNAVANQYFVWILPFLFFSNFRFTSGFHFWCIIIMGVYVPASVEGPFHLGRIKTLHPLMTGFLWAYCMFYLSNYIIRGKSVWEKPIKT